METLGEQRIGVNFNVSGDTLVDHFKSETASLINSLEEVKKANNPVNTEKLRLISLAQTAYEEAAMWAVKAVTI